MTQAGCAGHANLADELRDYAGEALDLLEPLVDRIREQSPDDAAPEPASCAVCPVCALITVLRGGRSELAVRLAEHAAGLLTVLRAALEEGIGAPPRHPGTRPDAATQPSPSAPPSPGTQPSPAAPPSPGTQPYPAPAAAHPTAAPRPDRPHATGQPHHTPASPRHRPAGRGTGRSGRLVQHIEVTRDGRAWPSPEPC
ncbi:MAG TPA: hypothetical protein VH008_17160 [Pseudonocardia sp.]|nr:hypothetical protein [Pseudonocardia sp.]